jgi:hypothetical protein
MICYSRTAIDRKVCLFTSPSFQQFCRGRVKAKPHSNASALQASAAKAREAKAAAAAAAAAPSSRAYETLGGEAGAGALQPGVTVAILSGPHGGSVGKITNSFGFEAMVSGISFFTAT